MMPVVQMKLSKPKILLTAVWSLASPVASCLIFFQPIEK